MKDLKAKVEELTTAKSNIAEQLDQEKQQRDEMAQQLKRELRELTESSELETRTKNEKIKRLQSDLEQAKRDQADLQSRQRADDNNRNQAEVERMRAKLEDEMHKLASCEKKLEEKSVEIIKINSQSKKL